MLTLKVECLKCKRAYGVAVGDGKATLGSRATTTQCPTCHKWAMEHTVQVDCGEGWGLKFLRVPSDRFVPLDTIMSKPPTQPSWVGKVHRVNVTCSKCAREYVLVLECLLTGGVSTACVDKCRNCRPTALYHTLSWEHPECTTENLSMSVPCEFFVPKSTFEEEVGQAPRAIDSVLEALSMKEKALRDVQSARSQADLRQAILDVRRERHRRENPHPQGKSTQKAPESSHGAIKCGVDPNVHTIVHCQRLDTYLEHSKRHKLERWANALLYLIAFLLGAIVGALWMRSYTARPVPFQPTEVELELPLPPVVRFPPTASPRRGESVNPTYTEGDEDTHTRIGVLFHALGLNCLQVTPDVAHEAPDGRHLMSLEVRTPPTERHGVSSPVPNAPKVVGAPTALEAPRAGAAFAAKVRECRWVCAPTP